jgi:hypothetical protein
MATSATLGWPAQASLLLANLSQIEGDLLRGAIVVIEPGRIRIRHLPLT